MKVPINVTAPSGINSILSNPIYLAIVVAAIIGIIYLVFHYRKKNQ